MILLNAFYKGLTGALGALLCYLLYLLYHYEISLIKKYRAFLKTHDSNDMLKWELVVFCVINFVIVWAISFGTLCAIFDWRTLQSEDSAAIALVISLIFNAFIAYTYYSKLPKSDRIKTVKQSSSNTPSSPKLPDTNSSIVKFNYFYSFEFLPQRLQDYEEHKISFDDVISLNALPAQYLKYAPKITITSSGLINDNDIQLTLIEIPSTKSISEVYMLLIIRSIKHNINRIYTLEHSIDDFCVCDVTAKTHNNLGLETSDGDEFLGFCLANFRKYLPKEETINNASKDRKDSSAAEPNTSSESSNISDKLLDSTPTTDIYGTQLTNRLKDIFDCIQEGADWMIKQMVEMPTVSVQGRMETEIVIASILSNEVDTGIVIQSLLVGNPLYNNIGITTINSKISEYKSLYEQLVARSYVLKSWPLIDFARQYGKLKIADFKIEDGYGHKKCPVFISSDDKILQCHFDFDFEEENITPNYISAQKDNIVVEKRNSGDLVFVRKSDIRDLYDSYFDMMGYNILIKPLDYHPNMSELEIVVALEAGRITLSSANPIIGYAFSEGKRLAEGVASSTGIIGHFNHNSDADDLP